MTQFVPSYLHYGGCGSRELDDHCWIRSTLLVAIGKKVNHAALLSECGTNQCISLGWRSWMNNWLKLKYYTFTLVDRGAWSIFEEQTISITITAPSKPLSLRDHRQQQIVGLIKNVPLSRLITTHQLLSLSITNIYSSPLTDKTLGNCTNRSSPIVGTYSARGQLIWLTKWMDSSCPEEDHFRVAQHNPILQRILWSEELWATTKPHHRPFPCQSQERFAGLLCSSLDIVWRLHNKSPEIIFLLFGILWPFSLDAAPVFLFVW